MGDSKWCLAVRPLRINGDLAWVMSEDGHTLVDDGDLYEDTEWAPVATPEEVVALERDRLAASRAYDEARVAKMDAVQERDAALARAEALEAKITRALDWANGRFGEWGERAENVEAILLTGEPVSALDPEAP
jgi:hypothetical protein